MAQLQSTTLPTTAAQYTTVHSISSKEIHCYYRTALREINTWYPLLGVSFIRIFQVSQPLSLAGSDGVTFLTFYFTHSKGLLQRSMQLNFDSRKANLTYCVLFPREIRITFLGKVRYKVPSEALTTFPAFIPSCILHLNPFGCPALQSNCRGAPESKRSILTSSLSFEGETREREGQRLRRRSDIHLPAIRSRGSGRISVGCFRKETKRRADEKNGTRFRLSPLPSIFQWR